MTSPQPFHAHPHFEEARKRSARRRESAKTFLVSLGIALAFAWLILRFAAAF